MQSSMIQVQEYFNCHIKQKLWQDLPEAMQIAAVKTAEEDIMLALGSRTLDLGDLLVFCAVCEQALYLALEAQRPADHNKLKSESIEGIGKREYFAASENRKGASGGGLSPRSELFLSRLPGYGISRFNRG